MKLIDRLLRRVPETQHVETRVIDSFGGWFPADGQPSPWGSTFHRGMEIPGAWRAATLVSDLVGSFPWHLYRERDGVATRLPTPPLLEQPSPPDTRMDTFSAMALDLVWHGNAVALIAARDAQGYPTAILPWPADQVGVGRNADGVIEYAIGGRAYSQHEVIHVKGPHAPGALRGLGVLEAHCSTLDLAHEQNRQARGLANNGVPTGLLQATNPDLTEAEAEKIKARWLQAQRTRTVAVLNSSVTFEALGWDPEKMQLVEARRLTREDLALIFGLPARYLLASSGDSMTYSNIQAERLDLLQTSSLVGHLARFEAALTAQRPRGQFVKANHDAWLRGDTLTRYRAHAVAIDRGFLTRNEVRELEDLEPLLGGDALTVERAEPLSLTPDAAGDDE